MLAGDARRPNPWGRVGGRVRELLPEKVDASNDIGGVFCMRHRQLLLAGFREIGRRLANHVVGKESERPRTTVYRSQM